MTHLLRPENAPRRFKLPAQGNIHRRWRRCPISLHVIWTNVNFFPYLEIFKSNNLPLKNICFVTEEPVHSPRQSQKKPSEFRRCKPCLVRKRHLAVAEPYTMAILPSQETYISGDTLTYTANRSSIEDFNKPPVFEAQCQSTEINDNYPKSWRIAEDDFMLHEAKWEHT